MWFYCKWKEAYDCPNLFCNYCVYNFKVISYQIVLHNCAQKFSLNQIIWNTMFTMSNTNQLSRTYLKTLPLTKKFNAHFTCCITYLVIDLINIWAPFFISILCIGVSIPLEKITPSFLRSLLLNLLTVQSLLFRQSPLLIGFSWPPIKIGFFSEPP